MKMRRLLSMLLAFALVMSCLTVGFVAVSAAEYDTAEVAADIDAAYSGSTYTDMLSKVTAENNYGLSATVNDGTILQAWNWSYANIEANLETVAEQGFTTIQVSPPNEIKKGTKGAKVLQSDNQNGWWMFYQPAGFQLNNSTDNALGTKAEFVSMCSKAHQLGLKVIVDAVINHMGTKEGDDSNTSSDPMSHVTPRAQTFEPEIYNNKLFHSPWEKMTYKEDPNQFSQYESTYDLTRNCTSGLPDLKTEDARVQSAIYDYMEELIEAGADGFRFDAAKHIETPDDINGLRSDFWTNTLQKVQKNYPDKEIYAYGEILNNCGVNRPFSMYTKLFDVTDSGSYWGIKNAVTGEYSGNPIPYYPNTNFTAANTMLWDESHDTYVDGSTTSLNTTQRGKIWALVAGRAGISSVYLARPDDGTNTNALYSITLGDVKKTAWSNATTKAINQFHNYFIGQSEYCSNSGGTAWIERGTKGAMIVNLGGTTTKTVNLRANRLTAGTYKDAITGNTFTVSGGYIKGNVGSTGVAVIYENEYVAPTEPPVTYYLGDVDEDEDVSSVDATMIMRYTVDMVTFTDKQLLEGDVDGDKVVSIIDATFVQRYLASMSVKYPIGEKQTYSTNPVTPTTPPTPTTPGPNPTTGSDPTDPPIPTEHHDPVGSFLLTDNFGWGVAYVYAWDANGNALNGEWPGASQAETEINEFGETQFRCYIPDGAVGVILNNGAGAQTEDITDFTYDGYWMDGTQNSLGHYKVTGWRLVDPTTVEPTDPPVVEPTDPPVIIPTEHHDPVGSFLLTDNFGWGAAYVYAWDANGNALNGEWPGASQAETVINEYGETQFRCYVPDGAVGVILNNGAGAQTEDITDFTYDGYWMDGSQNSLGHYIVTGWRLVDPTTIVEPTDPPVVNPTNAPEPPVGDDGYYLIGSFSNWAADPQYKFTENSGNPGEYMLSTTLTEGAGVKVVSVENGALATWYPTGEGNDYTVDAAHAGDVTIYFKPAYQADWSAFGGYFYIDSGYVPPVDDPTDPPVIIPTEHHDPVGSFLLTDNFGWGAAYVYAWDANGNALNGEWPGASQAETVINEYGETQFRCYVPDGAVGVILNNGAGAQTEDITDFTYDGYWMDGTKNSLGHYIVTGWRLVDPPVEDPTDPPVVNPTNAPEPPVGDDGYYLIGSFSNWAADPQYKFTENSGNPGEYMLSTTLTEGAGVKVVSVENGALATWYPTGEGNDYTVDAAHAGDVTIYFKPAYQADWSAFGGYFYIDSGYVPPVDDPTDPPVEPTQGHNEDQVSFLLTDNFGWGTAFVYAWDANGNALCGEWPGASQAETVTNDFGETQFRCYVPEGAVGVILNNGKGAQTEDITDFGTYTGYWMDGSQNSQGHYKVIGWN